MASILMINLIWYLCMLIVFISFSSFEARFLDDPNMFLKNGNSGASEHIIVRQVSKTSVEKQEMIEKHFELKKQELLRDDDESRVLKMESAKKMFKESVRRQEALGKFFESKRVSPGGPDPHHHKLL
ncbi:hypothetical protein Ddye_026666 [Dipteronia dyeriana]|uniref:Uncharacterized protein n=1 Tax=Dipteronia dyeriana TaxID=168575 RepID=A0AAD9TN54_9ROSI|nr:hypothetical protein Ddye_026666 [Dipteronia dyeriana]